MKITKFGTITITEDEVKLSDFSFDGEGTGIDMDHLKSELIRYITEQIQSRAPLSWE